jgi:Arc/MetJ-type ribon-helix-helix transcriptional regulator
MGRALSISALQCGYGNRSELLRDLVAAWLLARDENITLDDALDRIQSLKILT